MSVGVSPQSGGRAFPGQAEANEEAELSFRVGGSLIELSANIGDTVKKGQVLANLDPTDFQVRLRDADAELSSAEANLEVATVSLPRSRKSFAKRAGPQVDVDRAAAQGEPTKANAAALRTKRGIGSGQLPADNFPPLSGTGHTGAGPHLVRHFAGDSGQCCADVGSERQTVKQDNAAPVAGGSQSDQAMPRQMPIGFPENFPRKGAS